MYTKLTPMREREREEGEGGGKGRKGKEKEEDRRRGEKGRGRGREGKRKKVEKLSVQKDLDMHLGQPSPVLTALGGGDGWVRSSVVNHSLLKLSHDLTLQHRAAVSKLEEQ